MSALSPEDHECEDCHNVYGPSYGADTRSGRWLCFPCHEARRRFVYDQAEV